MRRTRGSASPWALGATANVPFRRRSAQVDFLTKTRAAGDYGDRPTREKIARASLLGGSDRAFADASSGAAGPTA